MTIIMSTTIHGYVLADLHWGAINPQRFMEELDAYLFTEIQKEHQLDFIVICGDFFDSKEYLSSDTVRLALSFINKLIYHTHDFNTEIYIIEGTRSHDNYQLDTLHDIFNVYCNCSRFHIINNVQACNDFAGYDCTALFIPEEYMVNDEEYYKEFFGVDKKYDFIFGHGMTDAMRYAKIEKKNRAENNSTHMVAPIFDVEQLMSIGRHVYFGHIHTRKEVGAFRYVGSYTKWEFGNVEDVGYYKVSYDIDTKDHADEFIINYSAPVLPTSIINIDTPMDLTQVNDILVKEVAKKLVDGDRLRLIVNLKSDLPNFLSIRDFIVTRVGQMKFVKLILSTDVSKSSIDDMKETMEQKRIEKGYIFDTNIGIENRIQEFINSKTGKDISIEDIKGYLNMKL